MTVTIKIFLDRVVIDSGDFDLRILAPRLRKIIDAVCSEPQGVAITALGLSPAEFAGAQNGLYKHFSRFGLRLSRADGAARLICGAPLAIKWIGAKSPPKSKPSPPLRGNSTTARRTRYFLDLAEMRAADDDDGGVFTAAADHAGHGEDIRRAYPMGIPCMAMKPSRGPRFLPRAAPAGLMFSPAAACAGA